MEPVILAASCQVYGGVRLKHRIVCWICFALWSELLDDKAFSCRKGRRETVQPLADLCGSLLQTIWSGVGIIIPGSRHWIKDSMRPQSCWWNFINVVNPITWGSWVTCGRQNQYASKAWISERSTTGTSRWSWLSLVSGWIKTVNCQTESG